jgi:hypothetical protein
MRGTLERGQDPKGPELYCDCDELGSFPVAVASNQELEFLRTLVGRPVKFTPKTFGVKTNAQGRPQAVVFATNVEPVYTIRPTINGHVN